MAKKLLPALAASDDAKAAVTFHREHGSELLSLLEKNPQPLNFPGLRPPIVAALLQPVSNGDEAQAIVLQLAPVQNCFRIDMYGYFQSNNLFKFRVKAFTYNYLANGNVDYNSGVEILYTAPMLAKTCDASVMQAAMVATRGVTNTDVQVSMGNLIVSDSLINNQSMGFLLANVLPMDRPTSQVFSFAGCWYISFNGGQFANKAMAMQILDEQGRNMSSTSIQALVATATQLIPGNKIERVRDIHQTSVMGPLVGGSVVVAIDIPGIGYSIISASPREFFVSSQQ